MSLFPWHRLPRSGEGIWGPDAFAWCWDYLDDANTYSGVFRPEQADDMAEPWRLAVTAGDGWITDELRRRVDSAAARSPLDFVVLRLLVALDRGYRGSALRYGGTPPWPLEERWLTNRCDLKREVDGRVIRHGHGIQEGRGLSRYCVNLQRIREPMASRLVFEPPLTGSQLGARLASVFRRGSETFVAFIPSLTLPTDLAFVPRRTDGVELFDVIPEPTRQEAIRGKFRELVSRLEAAQVLMAVFPEDCLSVASVGRLQAELERNAREHVPPNLLFVAVGVADGTANEAWLLGPRGERLLRQPKQQGWLLDRAQQDRYGLARELTPAADRREGIAEHGDLYVLEDPSLGRVIVLICEDLARVTPARNLAVELGPALVIAPVLDGSLRTHRWAFRGAANIADEPGSLVLVANSAVMNSKAQVAGRGFDANPGVAIVAPPKGRATIADWDGRYEFLTQPIDLDWFA